MNSYFRRIDQFSVQHAERMMRYRWLVIAIAVVACAMIGSGGQRLEFSNNYRAFFSTENPELTAFETLQATYTRNDNILFVLMPEDGQAFGSEPVQAVEYLTEQAWKIPFAIRVDSVTNFQHTQGIEDDLIVADLIRGAADLSDQQLIEKQTIALDEPLLRNQLLTLDSKAIAVNVTLQYPEKDLMEVPQAVAFARDLRAQIEADYPGIDVAMTGVSMLNNAFTEAGFGDMSTLVPLMFLVIVLLTLLIIRSFSGTFITVVIIMLSTMVGMGTAGFVGIKLTPISGSAPIVILTLAIADSIHILVSLRTALREGLEKRAAIVEAIRVNFLPVSITSLTTIVGFLSLNFSDSPPFWHLGNITAVGIAAAWLLSITILPALVSLLPFRVKPADISDANKVTTMTRLANVVIANPRKLLIGLSVASLVVVTFIPTIAFNDQWVEYFDKRIEFRTDSDLALQHFGMYPIEYSVPAAATGGVNEPEYLRNLEQFTEFLRTRPEVSHVYSLTDIMQRLNKNMHGDDPAFDRIPQNRELSAQYLLLYELSLPYGLDLNDRINVDKSATRVTATLHNATTQETKAFLDASRDWMQANFPDYMQAQPTSAQVMFTYITDRNVANMIGGTLFAIIAISLILMLALRSFWMGVLSMVPNTLPILVTFGVWALIVGEVGFSVATVASISLGIIVDDTVHFLSKFTRARREKALSVEDSIRYAFNSVGVAIIVNTVILTIGFTVLTFSAFKVNADMGLLTAIAIVFALILDFFLLPALLILLSRKDTATQAIGSTSQPIGVTSMFVMKSLMSIGLVVSLAAIGITQTGTAMAQEVTPERGETESQKKGFAIAARSDRTDRGFGNSDVKLQMILRNAAGDESVRSLKISTLEVADESVGDKSMVLFDKPRDINGTALLSHAKILDPDDQWLYLPALKRVKRISSANKSGPFVGSEFAFEDFTSLELNKYDYDWLREEPCGDMTCDVIERTPLYEYSGYTKQIAWVDQTDYQIRKVDFYDRRGDRLKTLKLSDYREYAPGVWRSHTFSMVNHQTNKSTDMVYEEYAFGADMDDKDFMKGKLSRLR